MNEPKKGTVWRDKKTGRVVTVNGSFGNSSMTGFPWVRYYWHVPSGTRQAEAYEDNFLRRFEPFDPVEPKQ